MFIMFIYFLVSCCEIYAAGCSTKAAIEPVDFSKSIQSYIEGPVSIFRQKYDGKPRNEWPFQFGDSELLGYLREITVDSNDASLEPVFEELSKRFEKSSPISILEVGCGSGRLSFELLARYPSSTLVTSDISEWVINAIPKNPRLTPIVFDATQVDSFPINTTFDAIVSVGAIRYFQDQQKVNEFAKLLKPKGLAVFVDYRPFIGGQLAGLRNVPRLTSFYILLHFYKTDPSFKELVDVKTTQPHKALLQVAGSKMKEAYVMIQKASEKEELVDQLENINAKGECSKVSCSPQQHISHLIVGNHYKTLGPSYERLWSYEEEFAAELVSDIQKSLNLQTNDVVADLGGGTGIWAEKLAKLTESPVFCVDPVEAMVMHSSQKKNVISCHQSILPFIQGLKDGVATKFLAKASIHHFDDRAKVIMESYNKLPLGGRFLIITALGNNSLPSTSLPLFQKLKESLKGQSARFNTLLIEECKTANFKVSMEEKHYLSHVPKETWFSMLRGRYMSPLSNFTDEEISAGIEELNTNIRSDILEIYGNYLFITLEK